MVILYAVEVRNNEQGTGVDIAKIFLCEYKKVSYCK